MLCSKNLLKYNINFLMAVYDQNHRGVAPKFGMELIFMLIGIIIFSVLIIALVNKILNKKEKKFNLYKNTKKNKKIESINKELKQTVKWRTEALEMSLTELKDMQNSLIEKEKMNALGTMVANVSHELNSPLGVCLTTITYLDSKKKELSNKSDLEEYKLLINQMDKGFLLIKQNLEDMAKRIEGFKHTLDTQIEMNKEKFCLNEVLDETVFLIKPEINKANAKMQINAEKNIILDSYPGAYGMIFTHLIRNSLNHGFEKTKNNMIRIEILKTKDVLKIYYSDNGKGLNNKKSFSVVEPFYTTKKEEGHMGLGLSIVSDLIKNKLNGYFLITSENGFQISIDIPLR